MESQDTRSIEKAIDGHIKKQGGPLSNWYVGITENIEQRLFGAHKVPKKKHWFIYRKAYSQADARSLEKLFVNKGCDGGAGGGDEDAIFVYAYLKTAQTNP